MSDWTSSLGSGWSIWIIALVLINGLGCCWLLWINSKRRPGDPAPDETSHVWDGDLTEYNKPMPKWWINLFWLTIVFGVGYLIYYPGFGAFAGVGKWTSAGEMKKEQAVENKKLEATFAPFAGKAIDQLAADPKAVAIGKGIFNNTCATCHGSGAKGAIGYPNLTDRVWKWGGTPDDVKAYCKRIIDYTRGKPGLIMDAALMLDEARPENLKAMFDFTREYGVYR